MQALQKNANNTSNTYVHVKQVQVIKVRHIIQIMQVIHLKLVHLVFDFRVFFLTEDILHFFFSIQLFSFWSIEQIWTSFISGFARSCSSELPTKQGPPRLISL